MFETLSECQGYCSSQRYTCGGDVDRALGGVCVPNGEGEFNSLEQCLNCCGAPRYTCTIIGRADGSATSGSPCVVDSEGEFATLEDCEAECAFGRYSCQFDSNGGFCVADPNGPLTEADCLADICNAPIRSEVPSEVKTKSKSN